MVVRLLNQLKDPMIVILIATAIISGITAAYSGESFADVIIIMAVVIINSVLGVYQESKAEKAIEALQAISAATSRVKRDGKIFGDQNRRPGCRRCDSAGSRRLRSSRRQIAGECQP